jgi:hypothetical protein
MDAQWSAFLQLHPVMNDVTLTAHMENGETKVYQVPLFANGDRYSERGITISCTELLALDELVARGRRHCGNQRRPAG